MSRDIKESFIADVEFENLLTSGGDERNFLLNDGLNRYYVNPLKDSHAFNRGSCTCNVLNPEVHSGVYDLYEKIKTGEISFVDARAGQKIRLKKMMGELGEVDFDFFFAPSGSDLCYYPILFSSLLYPDKPIMNIVTCMEEIGTGSLFSNRGLFHGEYTQVSANVGKGTPLNSDIRIDFRPFQARDAEGNILEHKNQIKDLIRKHENDYSIIANFVIGSKSGIEDNIEIIEEMRAHKVIWVVDLCQLRTTPELVKSLLKLNCCLMITGSKFYQSPPFSGAMLVPGFYLNALKSKRENLGFDRIFTKYDFPSDLALRESFSDFENVGLLLRWEAAILEMEKLSLLEERRINYVITKWNMVVVERLNASSHFELLIDQIKTNKSIISFKVRRPQGGFYGPDDLKRLHKHIALSEFEFPNGYNKVLIGQTVECGQGAFLRLALGSYNIRKLLEMGMDLSDDMYLIDMLEEILVSRDFASDI